MTTAVVIVGVIISVALIGYLIQCVGKKFGISDGDKWRSVTEYSFWRRQQITELPNSKLKLGDGSLTKDKGNLVLDLVGTPYGMGYQHGRLLHDQIRNGVVPDFAQPLKDIPAFKWLPSWLQRLAQWYLDVKIYAPLERNAPKELLAELKGMADGAFLAYRDIFRANFLSDMKMVMLPGELKRQNGLLNKVTECSSVVVGGARSESGNLLFGRNTDYVGGDRWCLEQVILRYKPSQGYSYVSITSAGMLKCNSAMNQFGLVVGGHFMGFAGANSDGASFTFLEHMVMRSCRTVSEAHGLVKAQKAAGSFAFTLADSTNSALLVEVGSEGVAVNEMDDEQLVVTNCAQTEKYKPLDLMHLNGVMSGNIQGRLKRVKQWLGEHSEKVTPENMAQLMGDRCDAYCGEERSSASTVGFKDNVTSVVFEPTSLKYWVATGSAPICDNEYQAYHFHEELNEVSLNPYQWENKSRLIALRRWMRLEDAGNTDFSYCESELDRCIELDPDNPRYYFEMAKLQLTNGLGSKSLQVLEHVKIGFLSPSEKVLFWFLSGASYIQMSNGVEANSCFESAISISLSVSEGERGYDTEPNTLLIDLVKKAKAGKKIHKILPLLKSDLFH